MLGISYGELFLLLGATASLIGPKDLPIIARTAGRFAGRAVGYVQLARGQFENVMQQSQANQVHKELQDTMAQLEAIRHEIRSISIMNPGPLTRRLVDSPELTSANTGNSVLQKLDGNNRPTQPKLDGEDRPTEPISKEHSSTTPTAHCSSTASIAANLQSQATAFSRLAESQTPNSDSLSSSGDIVKPDDETGLINILPVSAESAGLLPNRTDDAKGSDIMLEAVVEAEVAQNAKEFFVQHQDKIKFE